MKKKCLCYAKDVLTNSLLIIVFVWLSSSLSAQNDSFVYIENGNMYYECDEFYPMTCNYKVFIFKTQSDGFHISPAPSYCSDNPVNNCLPWVNCGDSVSDWKDKIEQHLLKIADLNFNSIRINGLQLQVDSSITGLHSRTYYDEIDHPCYDTVKDGFAVENDSTYRIIGDLMQDIVDIVKNNDTLKALKLIFTMGEDKNEIFQDEYANYLDYISDRFKHETQILGYDLFNEPFFNDDISSDTLSKYERAQIFYHWYRTIKNNAPAHLVTIGSKLHGVINWDAQVLPCDFISFHVYSLKSPGDNYDFNAAYERYKVKLKWIYESFDLPLYIMGETGLPGIDSVENLYPGVPSESEQLQFAKRSLTHVPWMGMKGYSWWVYKDTKEWPDTISGANQNYFGLIRRGMPGYGEVNKPLAEKFENFTHVYQFDTCTYPNDDLYHHPNPENYTNNVLSGTVTAPDSTPLRNVFIMVSQYEPISDASQFYETSFAITDSAGQFEIMSGLDSCHVEKVRASFPGMTAIDTTEWGIGFQSPLHLIIDYLDPDSLPQPVAHRDTLIIANADTISWDSLLVVHESYIRVDSGGLLNVTDTTWMMPGAKIVVMPGGKMIVNGGMLTGFCTWDGVEVWGNDTLSQTAANQGKIELENGATIKNAQIAVRIGKSIIASPEGGGTPQHDTKGGGIIIAENASFINNNTGVLFEPYTYNNTSRFLQCEFLYDQEITGEELIWFAKLNSVKHVRFAGCDFTNNTGTTGQCRGIWSYNSTFYVKNFCTQLYGDECIAWDTTFFTNLEYGIYALASTTVPYADVRDAVFTNNLRGIYLSGMTLPRVTSNTFEMTTYSGTDVYGLYLDQCTEYWVEDNNLSSVLFQNSNTIGIVVNESGYDPNEIYRNTFDYLEYSILAQGLNRNPRSIAGEGLVCKCNEFTDNAYDIVVSGESSPYGIAQHQGSSAAQANAPAGNLFSWTGPAGTDTDINNQGLHISYYYHVVSNPQLHLEPKYYDSLKVNAVPNPFANWDTTSCVSYIDTTGGGSTEEEMRGMLAESKLVSDSISHLIQTLEDAGDTESLEWTVDMSVPEQSYEVYNQLMNTAPYISDTVMESAIEKEDVLPGAMIRDVMVASPEAARNDDLLEKLNERVNQLPGYMLVQILQGRSLVSIYGDLLSKKSYHNNRRTFALKSLKRMYVCDSENQVAQDTLMALLHHEADIHSTVQLAFLYLQQRDSTSAINTLASIPTKNILDENQLQAHTMLTNFMNLLIGMQSNVPDSLQTDWLINAATEGDNLTSVFSRNLLLGLGWVDYSEPILLPKNSKSTLLGGYNNLQTDTPNPGCIEAYPNPATDHTIVKWALDMYTASMSLRLTSVEGKTIYETLISGSEGQKVISTENLLPGIYIITLQDGSKTIESIKLSIN